MNTMGLWDEQDGFYYDVLHRGSEEIALRIRSMVGLIPLFAVEPIPSDLIAAFPDFARRLEWFIDNRPDLTEGVACMRTLGKMDRRLFSVVNPDKLRKILQRLLDESEFLSPHGVRALSRVHRDQPYRLKAAAGLRRLVLHAVFHAVDLQPVRLVAVDPRERAHPVWGKEFQLVEQPLQDLAKLVRIDH